jgi:hypothetical protein
MAELVQAAGFGNEELVTYLLDQGIYIDDGDREPTMGAEDDGERGPTGGHSSSKP